MSSKDQNVSQNPPHQGDPFDNVVWIKRTARLTNAAGDVIFEQKDVEVPAFWSQTATDIMASKYLWGALDSPQRETGARMMITRVVEKITEEGQKAGYFSSVPDAVSFANDLKYLLVYQLAAFNSPVWFNVGCDRYEPHAQAQHWYWDNKTNTVKYGAVGYDKPQCSACFINSVEDSMEGIMQLAATEARLFKFGSGTGTNFSSLRSSQESVSGGGEASGPLSFMRGLDAFAGVIKSGGKTRRAAKMAILNATHPDIEEFINCKRKEEKKAYALMKQGYDGSSGPDSEAYSSIFYQNANNSVRVTNEFMQAAINDADTSLHAVTNGEPVKTVKASYLLDQIAEATWECGDPGMQFDTTINDWHTCKATDRIYASNPCSEFMFLDNTACNLASLNLLKFLKPDGSFDVHKFTKAVHTLILAQDILVDMSGYPTEAIARNSHDFRPLGLGYANLGALLMAKGLAYDSDEGRAYAAQITSLMCGEAYVASAAMAGKLDTIPPAQKYTQIGYSGSFPGYAFNRMSMQSVIRQHLQKAHEVPYSIDDKLNKAARLSWKNAQDVGRVYGFRNAQVTVLAPTGTIGFLMDCDTTGIEPELCLVKYKKMVGGGNLKLVNAGALHAFTNLKYNAIDAQAIVDYIAAEGTVEGCPQLKPEHLSIFDTAFRPLKGTRSIHYRGHILMMAAVQPFLSGAISKTVNLPQEATVADIRKAYIESWEAGLKSVAIYRDGSKSNQVLVTAKDSKKEEVKIAQVIVEVDNDDAHEAVAYLSTEPVPGPSPAKQTTLDAPPLSVRHSLPDERLALTHKFSIAGHEGYINVGVYKNGQPGEVFISMAKEGSTISGLMDGFAIVVSIALQHGVPLETIVRKLAHTRFEPSGFTPNPQVKFAKSILDYVARWMEYRFLKDRLPILNQETAVPASVVKELEKAYKQADSLDQLFETGDSPSCSVCGTITVRSGSCYTCPGCATTTGCS